VRALARIPVATGLVGPTVGHAAPGRDAEVGVAIRLVSGQGRRWVADIDSVVTGMEDVISANLSPLQRFLTDLTAKPSSPAPRT
jgi:hypothetical protein